MSFLKECDKVFKENAWSATVVYKQKLNPYQ